MNDLMPDHHLARPLDEHSATQRALQAATLGNVTNLRVLSEVAAGVNRSSLKTYLDLNENEVERALKELESAGLLETGDSRDLRPSADAWARFGRLLAPPQNAHSLTAAPPVVALPPAVATVIDDLAYRFQGTFNHETVAQYVVDSYSLLSDRAQVRSHLISLTARYASDRLEALASIQGLRLTTQPEVLFVCVHNAGRSQMAGAILRHLAGDRVHVRTAGSSPAEDANPRVVAALEEIGVPVWGEFPKPLTDEVVRAADYVVTMGCGDACPVFPGRRYLEWKLQDPLMLDDEGLRRVRDEVLVRVEALLDDLDQAERQ